MADLGQAVVLQAVIVLRAVVVAPGAVREVGVEPGVVELHARRVEAAARRAPAEHRAAHPHASCSKQKYHEWLLFISHLDIVRVFISFCSLWQVNEQGF